MYFRPSKETEIPSCSQKVLLEHFTQSTDLVGRVGNFVFLIYCLTSVGTFDANSRALSAACIV